jgi:archaellum component FlaG (FlaF/FlaG flagellin family)
VKKNWANGSTLADLALPTTREKSPAYWGWLVFFIAMVLCLAALSIRLAGLYQTSKTQDGIERETRAAAERLRTYFTDISNSFSQQAERNASDYEVRLMHKTPKKPA